jgi:hypothetical protein
VDLAQVSLQVRLSGRADSQFQASVASNPFTDSHAIATLSNVSVDDVDRLDVSTYHVDNTDGRLKISFTALPSILTSDQWLLSS